MNLITDTKCPRCGGEMKQTGGENNRIRYHCPFCGSDAYVDMAAEDNAEYWNKRAEILERVRIGVFEWKTAPWDYISRDIVNFMGRYEDASVDVRMKIALIACITRGFNNMDAEKYKECKLIFKTTERIYKAHLKALERAMREFPRAEDVAVYEEYRALYKKCRDEYRNTKLLWKAGFFIVKKLFFFIPGL